MLASLIDEVDALRCTQRIRFLTARSSAVDRIRPSFRTITNASCIPVLKLLRVARGLEVSADSKG